MKFLAALFTVYSFCQLLHCAENSYIRPYKPKVNDEFLLNRIQQIEHRIGLVTYDFEYALQEGNVLTVSVEVTKNYVVLKDKSMVFTIGSKRSRFSKPGCGLFRVQSKDRNGQYEWFFDMDQGASYGVTLEDHVLVKSDFEVANDHTLDKTVIFYGESHDKKTYVKILAEIKPGTFDDANPAISNLHK
jgi:hypothetical protein